MDTNSVRLILADDKWQEIEIGDLLPGDIVIYFSEEGDANHSGLVVQCTEGRPIIVCSKWGNGGEFLHRIDDCHRLYGPIKKFYRCQL